MCVCTKCSHSTHQYFYLTIYLLKKGLNSPKPANRKTTREQKLKKNIFKPETQNLILRSLSNEVKMPSDKTSKKTKSLVPNSNADVTGP